MNRMILNSILVICFMFVIIEPPSFYQGINSTVKNICGLGACIIVLIILGAKIRKQYLSVEAMFKSPEEEKR